MAFWKRCNFIFHEIYHLVNRKYFVIPEQVGTASSRYLNTLAIMYDEYSANRFALGILGEFAKYELIGDVKNNVTAEYKDFLSSLQDEKRYHLALKKEYAQWHDQGDTIKMLSNAFLFIDAAIKDIIYCYAFADSFHFINEDFAMQKSVFFNNDTEFVFKFLRKWYEREEADIEFEKGLEAIKSFMRTCFGIYFTDDEAGERFHLVPF